MCVDARIPWWPILLTSIDMIARLESDLVIWRPDDLGRHAVCVCGPVCPEDKGDGTEQPTQAWSQRRRGTKYEPRASAIANQKYAGSRKYDITAEDHDARQAAEDVDRVG